MLKLTSFTVYLPFLTPVLSCMSFLPLLYTAALAKQMLISEYEQFSFLRLVILTLILLLQVFTLQESQASCSVLWKLCNDITGEKSAYESSTDSVEYVVDSYIKEQISPKLQILCCTGRPSVYMAYSSFYQQKIFKCSTLICCFRKNI